MGRFGDDMLPLINVVIEKEELDIMEWKILEATNLLLKECISSYSTLEQLDKTRF